MFRSYDHLQVDIGVSSSKYIVVNIYIYIIVKAYDVNIA
jgi:hypothetical protein